MSMPNFPEQGIDLTKEQALHMLLGSIAMEELALSHIMNAEGEKLQYILGTLPNSPCPQGCATTAELLEVNHSIRDLLEHVNQSQMLLKGKLAQVLEALDRHCPAPPNPHPCPPSPCRLLFAAPRNFCWKRGARLPWDPLCPAPPPCAEDAALCRIPLPTDRPTSAGFSLTLRPTEPGPVSVAVYLSQHGHCRETYVFEDCACAPELTLTLSGQLTLTPEPGHCPPALVFVLRRPATILLCHGSLSLSPL